METFLFDLQRFADVIEGGSVNNSIQNKEQRFSLKSRQE